MSETFCLLLYSVSTVTTQTLDVRAKEKLGDWEDTTRGEPLIYRRDAGKTKLPVRPRRCGQRLASAVYFLIPFATTLKLQYSM